MITSGAVMGRHSANRGLDGYVTAWTGDLNADLPTQPLPLPTPPIEPTIEWATPDLNLLRRVLHGLRRL